jgi:hypothetical protein
MKHLFFAGLLVVAGCSFKKNPLKNQTTQGHEELYSEPAAPLAHNDVDVKRVVIAATHDIAGNWSPQILKSKDGESIAVGGADAMAAYFKVLHEQYQNVLLVDSGGLFSPSTDISSISRFYQNNGYDALTVGLHDFNQRLPKDVSSSSQLIQEFASKSEVPLLLSNIYELKTARGVEWKGTLPYLIKEIGEVKIGIIGLVSDDIVKLTPVDNRVALYLEDMLTNTLRQARLVRSLGADIVVVLTHQSLVCGQSVAEELKLPLSKVNFEPRKSGICETSNGFGEYLKRLPPHLVDVIIGGRGPEKMANYVNENLVLSGQGRGRDLIYAEFFVNVKEKRLLKEKTVVHQPVTFCREFFKSTQDCYTEDSSVDHKARIPATFLGKELGITEAPTAGLSTRPTIDHHQAMVDHEADIVFAPESGQNSQLVLLKIKGRELLSMLEEDFNSSLDTHWWPSPYLKDKHGLRVMIKGEDLSSESYYQVLTDLESITMKGAFRRAFTKGEVKSFVTHSWSTYHLMDSISRKMASQRQ